MPDPCKYKTSATAYDIHFTFVLLICSIVFLVIPQCAALQNPLRLRHASELHLRNLWLSVLPDLLIMDDAVIYRNSTDHCRTFTGQLSAKWLGITMAGQIHNGLCAHIYRTHYLLHLNVIIFAVSGDAQITLIPLHAACCRLLPGSDRYGSCLRRWQPYLLLPASSAPRTSCVLSLQLP